MLKSLVNKNKNLETNQFTLDNSIFFFHQSALTKFILKAQKVLKSSTIYVCPLYLGHKKKSIFMYFKGARPNTFGVLILHTLQ